jgi:hypothetical protein
VFVFPNECGKLYVNPTSKGKKMSNVINFLERVGQDAQLRHASEDELLLALASAQIDPALQAALIAKDQARLEVLLAANANVCCGLHPGKEDDDDSEEEPSKEDEEIAPSGIRGVAAAA